MPQSKRQASFSLTWRPSVFSLGSDVLIQVFSDMGVLVKFTPVNHGGLPYENSLLRMNHITSGRPLS